MGIGAVPERDAKKVITGIVVALPEELSTLTNKRIDKGHCVFIADRLLLAYSGVGGYNAKKAAELLASKGATQLMSWGCAGGLTASLKPGDLVVPEQLLDVDDVDMAVNQQWHRHACQLLAPLVRLSTGKLAETATIVASSKEKQQLHSFTKALAVDMESVAVAKVAAARHLPFLCIRAIVDPASMNLPRAIAYAANLKGDILLGKLLLYVALHPSDVPRLIRLGLHFNAAKATLKRIAQKLENVSDFCAAVQTKT